MAFRQLFSQRAAVVGRALRNGRAQQNPLSCARRSLFGSCYTPSYRSSFIVHDSLQAEKEDCVIATGAPFLTVSDSQNRCSTLVQTRSFHVTAQRENFLIYGVGAATAIVGIGWVADQVSARAEKNAKMEQNIPESSGGKNFYKGAFEPEMTKREAALILGVRESASKERIREAHRRVLMLNHPDTGGSTFVATKINEAKEMLLGSSGASGGGGDRC